MLYNFICSYVVACYGQNELDRKAIQTMVPGKGIDGHVLIIQILLIINLFYRFKV